MTSWRNKSLIWLYNGDLNLKSILKVTQHFFGSLLVGAKLHSVFKYSSKLVCFDTATTLLGLSNFTTDMYFSLKYPNPTTSSASKSVAVSVMTLDSLHHGTNLWYDLTLLTTLNNCSLENFSSRRSWCVRLGEVSANPFCMTSEWRDRRDAVPNVCLAIIGLDDIFRVRIVTLEVSSFTYRCAAVSITRTAIDAYSGTQDNAHSTAIWAYCWSW